MIKIALFGGNSTNHNISIIQMNSIRKLRIFLLRIMPPLLKVHTYLEVNPTNSTPNESGMAMNHRN